MIPDHPPLWPPHPEESEKGRSPRASVSVPVRILLETSVECVRHGVQVPVDRVHVDHLTCFWG